MFKQIFGRKSSKLLLLSTFTSVSLLITGCSGSIGRTTPVTSTGAQTAAVSSGVQTDGSASTELAETSTTAAPRVLRPLEQRYQTIIDSYLQQIPAEPIGELAVQAEQDTLLKDMKALFDQAANSETIFALYQKGIVQLAPEAADRFTAYAISGLRRNSFEDYVEIEQNYTNDPAFLETFFAEAEVFGFKYLAMNRQAESVKDIKVRALLDRATEQGYFAASTEGMIYYVVDFTQFARYRAFNSPAMAKLLETLAIDDLDPMANDGALVISDDILAARTWNIEQMLLDYQGTLYEKHLAVRFRDHLMMLMFGLDNTPTRDYTTDLLTDDAQAMFAEIKTLSESFMGQLIADFVAMIEANNGKIDDTIFEQSQTLFDRIDAEYGLKIADLEAFGSWMSGQRVA